MKRSHISLLVSAAMVIAPLPAMSADSGPLAPGGAAGVKQAQDNDDVPLLWLVGAGAVIALGALALSNNSNNNSPATTPTPTTTTTTTTTKAVTTTTTT